MSSDPATEITNKKNPLRCPICEAEQGFKTIFEGSHFLLQCPQCKLVFSNRITNPRFFDFYRENQNHFFERPYFQDTESKPNSDNPNYKRALARTRAFFGPGPARLLDVGCGTGGLLKVAKEQGFHAEGLEVSDSISKPVSQEFKVHVYDGHHDHFPAIDPFDAVSIWDVLEHLPDPTSFLRSLKGLIRSDGKLLLRTINEDCLLSQASLWMYRLTGGLFKAAAERMHEVHHVIYFNKDSLSACLRKSGYRIDEYWIGEFPPDRASSSKIIQIGLWFAYFLQRITKRTYEQYIVATPDEEVQSK